MELSAQRSAASSLQGFNRSRPQASLLPPAASFHAVNHVTPRLQQVLQASLCPSVHVWLTWPKHHHQQQQQVQRHLCSTPNLLLLQQQIQLKLLIRISNRYTWPFMHAGNNPVCCCCNLFSSPTPGGFCSAWGGAQGCQEVTDCCIKAGGSTMGLPGRAAAACCRRGRGFPRGGRAVCVLPAQHRGGPGDHPERAGCLRSTFYTAIGACRDARVLEFCC